MVNPVNILLFFFLHLFHFVAHLLFHRVDSRHHFNFNLPLVLLQFFQLDPVVLLNILYILLVLLLQFANSTLINFCT